MKKFFSFILFFAIMAFSYAGYAELPLPKIIVELKVKNHGTIIIVLDSNAAPQTVENFLYYVNQGFYNGTVFHRVIKGFMIQGGGFTEDMERKATERGPIVNEARTGLKNIRGTIAMARTNDPNSATSQFFINLVDNPSLDFGSGSSGGWGYCAFGIVIRGMDVVDSIANVYTAPHGPFNDVPLVPVIIDKVARR